MSQLQYSTSSALSLLSTLNQTARYCRWKDLIYANDINVSCVFQLGKAILQCYIIFIGIRFSFSTDVLVQCHNLIVKLQYNVCFVAASLPLVQMSSRGSRPSRVSQVSIKVGDIEKAIPVKDGGKAWLLVVSVFFCQMLCAGT